MIKSFVRATRPEDERYYMGRLMDKTGMIGEYVWDSWSNWVRYKVDGRTLELMGYDHFMAYMWDRWSIDTGEPEAVFSSVEW